MSSRDEALITPSVMKWARKKAKLTINEVASKIKRPVEDIEAWEAGKSRPSIAQARNVAEVYKRPLALFYMPDPPQGFEILKDFRSLSDSVPEEYSPELALLIRTTQFRQEWMYDHLAKEDTPPLAFVGSASLDKPAVDVAENIRQVLQLTPNDQMKSSTRYEALRLWMNKTEEAGVFVFRQRYTPVIEARGFVLSDDLAPFIFINSADGDAAQLFTLAHELAHLWLNVSALSNLEPGNVYHNNEAQRIETYCNRVAGEAILEENAFMQEWNKQIVNNDMEECIKNVSRQFKVSEEVVARRLLNKGIINQNAYMLYRQTYQERWEEYQAQSKPSSGGPSYYTLKASQNGYAFTRMVVSGFQAGTISGRDASALLQVKVNKLGRLGEKVGLPASSRGE